MKSNLWFLMIIEVMLEILLTKNYAHTDSCGRQTVGHFSHSFINVWNITFQKSACRAISY